MILALRILLGLVFIASGLLKLYPVEPFEFEFVDLGMASFDTAPFIARFLISVEIFLGTLIVLNQWLRKWVLPSTILLLLFFSVYLIFQLAKNGNDINCGCFGTWISMTPVEALIKNGFLLAIAFVLLRRNKPWAWNPRWLAIVLFIATLATPHILNYVSFKNVHSIAYDEVLEFGFDPILEGSGAAAPLGTGRNIIAFFSSTCQHCKHAAKKLFLISKEVDLPQIYMVMHGSDKRLEEFLFDTRVDFPIIRLNDDRFFGLVGGILPTILYVEEGKLKKRWLSELFDIEELKELADG